MFFLKSRRERERVILQEMIRMYCNGNHTGDGKLCEECQALANYAEKRLLSCLYGEAKPVCKECPVHCYSPQRREQIRQVMHYSGPRMALKKPIFALAHLIDNITASKPKSKKNNQKK